MSNKHGDGMARAEAEELAAAATKALRIMTIRWLRVTQAKEIEPTEAEIQNALSQVIDQAEHHSEEGEKHAKTKDGVPINLHPREDGRTSVQGERQTSVQDG